MRSSGYWRTGLATVAGGLLLVPGATPLLAGGDPTTIQVLSARTVGDLVEIVLVNPGQNTVSGTVTLLVQVDGVQSPMTVAFTVAGGQKTCIHVAAPGEVAGVLPAGVIVDDGAPF